jgi:prepilin-type N-terminal cleavage/methylation domain-containing protein
MEKNNIPNKVFTRLLFRNEGFTLIEVLISMAIFIIILSLTMVNHRQGEHTNTFRLQALNIEDSIRSVQNMALTGKKIDGSTPNAYGIFFSETGNNVIIYGDDGDNIFDNSNDSIYSEMSLDGGVGFNRYSLFCDGFVAGNSLNIIFIPPQPTMIINNNLTCSSSIIFMESNNVGGEWGVHFDAVSGRTWTEFGE